MHNLGSLGIRPHEANEGEEGMAGAPGSEVRDVHVAGEDQAEVESGTGLIFTDPATGRSWTTLDLAPKIYSSPDALPPLLAQVRCRFGNNAMFCCACTNV